MLDVSNTGSPIPAEEQARIFERYYRGRTSSGKPGTGLGLHISQEITRRYGGDTTLLRSDERGTCFRIVLPAAPEAAALLPGGAQLPLPADDSEQDAHHPDGPGAPASAALRRSGPSLT